MMSEWMRDRKNTTPMTPACWKCGEPIPHGARLVLEDGRMLCDDCAEEWWRVNNDEG